jgi:DNA-binding transcriptional ArsR family regulator
MGMGMLPADRVFHALADPTRRRVLERLSRGPGSVSELARPFAMALPSFMEHLRVLEGCGLVRSRKQGRVRTYRLAPRRLRLVEDWLARQRTLWERRLDQLDEHLFALKEQDHGEPQGMEAGPQAGPGAGAGH